MGGFGFGRPSALFLKAGSRVFPGAILMNSLAYLPWDLKFTMEVLSRITRICPKLPDGQALDGGQHHMNMRILHSGSKAQDKGDSRNRGLWDPCVSGSFFGPLSRRLGRLPGDCGTL